MNRLQYALLFTLLFAASLPARADDIPDAFSFTVQTGIVSDSTVVSNIITVSGIDGPSPIAITQCGSDVCEYAINGGPWTTAPGFVNNGDTIQVRQHASSNPFTETKLILSIGGVSDAFSVTTAGTAGSLQFEATDYTVAEGIATVTLKVTRSGGTTGTASVQYATANGSATAGSDYTAKTGTLTWAANDAAAKSIAVTIVNDALVEPNETFSVTLSNPVNVTLGTPNPATVTILDKSSVVQFNPATATVVEGTDAVITVSRQGSSIGPVTVNYSTANGTALAGSDYLTTTGTLTWSDGDAADKTISVPVINDYLIEAAENFKVNLISASGAILGTAKIATVTIADNEAANTIQFNPATLTVNEGAGTASLTVTRTGTPTGGATATWSTADGTAKSGLDYTASSGTLTWAAGDTAPKTITIPIIDDTLVEPAENFKVNLTTAVGATLGSAKAATVTIADNESGAGTLQFTASNYTVKENIASITISVTRTDGATGAISVQYATLNGSATAGSDYTLKTGTLTWANNDAATKTIVVPILNDSLTEGTETFTVTLASPTGGAVIGAISPASVSIIDDETPATVGIEFAARKYTVAENGGSITLTVNRDPANAGGAASVSYATANGSAMTGTDYLAQTGSLSWAAGDSSPRSIIVPIVNDALAEVTESFNVTLSNAAGNSLGTIPVATVTVLDDDEIFPPGGQLPSGLVIPAGASAGWFVDYSQYQAGVASLRSGSIGDNQNAAGEISANFQNGMISFALKTSSQAGSDNLRFYIDGEKKGEWSGLQSAWTTVSYPLVAGPHTLRWAYEKDDSLIAGSDAAWIDTVNLPAVQ
ncbi:MAG: Calx-beta domain-containing protein [Pseudomonadota bacterium]